MHNMAIDGDSALENVLNLIQSSVQTGLTKGEEVLQGVLGPAYEPIKGLAQFITPDIPAIYEAGKQLVKEPSPSALTAVAMAGALESPMGKAIKPIGKLRSIPKVKESVTANKAFNITPEQKEVWREENLQATKEKVAKELGITNPKEIKNINVRDRHRNPELEEVTRKFDEGEITRKEFLDLKDEIKPLRAYGTVPVLRSLKDVFLSLRQGKGKDLSIIGVNKNIKPNTVVESRFDIDAYSKYDNYVASVKEPSGMSYTNAVYLKDVNFVFNPEKAFNIAKGKPKSPFATIKGKWQNAEPEDIHQFAKEKINLEDWTEVGFDPASHTGFYNRTNGELLKSAEEVIQVGPMILAKKVKRFEPEELAGPRKDKVITSSTGKKMNVYKKGGSIVERNPYNYTPRTI